jgi:hypothetical protein
MPRTGDEDEVPPMFDDENNTNNNQEGDKSGAFRAPSLEDLMRRLDENNTNNNYNNMLSSTTYTSIPVGKSPYFDGTSYNQWKHCIKNYLYSISPEVWQVICDDVEFPDEDEQPTSDELQKIHHNAQAISILTSSIDKEEFNRVDGLDVTKDAWTTLRMTYEGSNPMIKAKIEMLKGQLNQFIMWNWSTRQEL